MLLAILLIASLLSLWVHFFYRNLETQKILGLKLQNGEFDTNITLNVHSEKEIYWWKNNIFEFLLILTFLTQTSQYMLMQV